MARAERPSYAADRRPEYAVSPPDIPPTARRRRASPDELFERVVPEDPPAVPFGRIPRADDPTITRSAPPATAAGGAENAPADEELSIRFDRRHTPPDEADETLPGDTLPLRGDDTLPLRDDDTRTLGGDETLPLERDDTLPLRADETVPLGEDDTLPDGDDDTLPDGDDDTLPLDRRRKRR